jgi:hypothetical protein
MDLPELREIVGLHQAQRAREPLGVAEKVQFSPPKFHSPMSRSASTT